MLQESPTGESARTLPIAVAGALALVVLLGAPALQASPEAAHEHFVRASELAGKGELRGAKREFELAYEESPHPAVLYNLARLCHELGEVVEARHYGERFLESAGPDTPEQQRQAIHHMLVELSGAGEASAARAEVKPANSVEGAAIQPRPPEPSRPARAREPDTRVDTSCKACVTPAHAGRLVVAERQRAAGIVLGAAGAAVTLAGASILVWNETQVSDAEAEKRGLEAGAPPAEVTSQEKLAEILDYERAVAANQSALDSAGQFDIVGWSMVGVGAAMLATGVVLVLTRPRESAATLSLRGTRLELNARF